jgi:hypothetical protein
MSTEKIVGEAAEKIQTETSEQLEAAQASLAAREAEAQAVAAELAAAAIEGERGKIITDLKEELSKCQNEIQQLREQVSALAALSISSTPAKAPLSEPIPTPLPDPLPSKAPIVEPEMKPGTEAAPAASAAHTPKKPTSPHRWI